LRKHGRLHVQFIANRKSIIAKNNEKLNKWYHDIPLWPTSMWLWEGQNTFVLPLSKLAERLFPKDHEIKKKTPINVHKNRKVDSNNCCLKQKGSRSKLLLYHSSLLCSIARFQYLISPPHRSTTKFVSIDLCFGRVSPMQIQDFLSG